MMESLVIPGLAAGAYLLGALPFGLLLARARGVDIRKVGSGNIGATNVFRCAGKGIGILTLVLDALKGFVPAFFFHRLGNSMPPDFGILFGVLAIAGHNWPVYLRFKGGKGVATSAGVLLGIAPAAAGIGLVVFVLLFLLTRYISVGSMGAALVIPFAGWFLYGPKGWLLPSTLTLLGGLVIWRHRSNIRRLREGTEIKL